MISSNHLMSFALNINFVTTENKEVHVFFEIIMELIN